jgi:hypothetical protein
MKTSLSKPKNVQLKPYEFKPKDLEAFVQQYAKIDPVADMKEAKKARTAIKKKIKEIKDVHTGNKKSILTFKREAEAYDKQKFEDLTVDLAAAFSRIDKAIEKIEVGAELEAQRIENNIKDLGNTFNMAILDATTIESIQEVQVKINEIAADKSEYGDRIGEVETIKTQLVLRAGSRQREIENAGGNIGAVKPIKMAEPGTDLPSGGTTDTEMLNFIQSVSASKGWTVNINPNTGVQIYQVDDPSAPKDIRVAIREAMANHEGI